MAIQTISSVPEAGHRGVDIQTTFVSKQENFQDHLRLTLVPELNQYAQEISDVAINVTNAISLNTIEDLASYTGAGLVMVKDITRGGIFISKTVSEINPHTGSLYAVDSGTIFAKLGGGFWARQYNGAINVKWFGTLNATTLYNALLSLNGQVYIDTATTLNPTLVEATLIIAQLDRILFNEEVTINLPSGEIGLTSRVELTNPTFMNLILKGVDTASTTLSNVTMVSNATKNHSVKYTVSNGTNFVVGNYALITGVTGTGDYYCFNGCFKVTAVSGNDITVKHTLAGATFPTYTITGGTIYPLKSIIRWTNSVGLAIAGTSLRTLSNVVLAGNYNISTSTPADSAIDGLQIGTAANTPETGLNESERQTAGSGYFARIGIVEWEGNGVQCLGGSGYFVLSSFCSNGWRGCQAAANGSVSAKGSSAIGNGASGYEAEAGGFMGADNSVSCGNNQQGYYSISPSYLSAYNSKAINNITNGYESKNNGDISLEASTGRGNLIYDAIATNSKLLIGDSTTLGTLRLQEGSFADCYNASSITTITLASGCSLIGIDGVEKRGTFSTIGTHMSTGYNYTIAVSSIGDATYYSNQSGSNVAKFTMKAGGTFRPAADNTQTLGDATNRWSTVYAGTGTINTSDDRLKTYLEVEEKEKLIAKELKSLIKKYKFNDSIKEKGLDSARIHFGTSAQSVKEVFEKYELNAFDYALLCYDEWEEQEELKDENGNILQEFRESGNRYGIRYEELLCFMISSL